MNERQGAPLRRLTDRLWLSEKQLYPLAVPTIVYQTGKKLLCLPARNKPPSVYSLESGRKAKPNDNNIRLVSPRRARKWFVQNTASQPCYIEQVAEIDPLKPDIIRSEQEKLFTLNQQKVVIIIGDQSLLLGRDESGVFLYYRGEQPPGTGRKHELHRRWRSHPRPHGLAPTFTIGSNPQADISIISNLSFVAPHHMQITIYGGLRIDDDCIVSIKDLRSVNGAALVQQGPTSLKNWDHLRQEQTIYQLTGVPMQAEQVHFALLGTATQTLIRRLEKKGYTVSLHPTATAPTSKDHQGRILRVKADINSRRKRVNLYTERGQDDWPALLHEEAHALDPLYVNKKVNRKFRQKLRKKGFSTQQVDEIVEAYIEYQAHRWTAYVMNINGDTNHSLYQDSHESSNHYYSVITDKYGLPPPEFRYADPRLEKQLLKRKKEDS